MSVAHLGGMVIDILILILNYEPWIKSTSNTFKANYEHTGYVVDLGNVIFLKCFCTKKQAISFWNDIYLFGCARKHNYPRFSGPPFLPLFFSFTGKSHVIDRVSPYNPFFKVDLDIDQDVFNKKLTNFLW